MSVPSAAHAFRQRIEQAELTRLPRWQRAAFQLARLGLALHRDLTQGYLSLQAMGLVYTTLISIVPLLAVSFSVLKGFGVHNQLEPLLFNALEPLGAGGMEIAGRIVEFVDNMRVGVLGSVGLALLLYTVVSLLQKIEGAFNDTWRVRRARSFTQRFSHYLSVLLAGPVLIFAAFGLTASLGSTELATTLTAYEPLGRLSALAGRLTPLLIVWAAFAFIYWFVPNTRVNLRSAVIGALVAAVFWQLAGWVFATFMVGATRLAAVYSGFAILILFLTWVYVGWLILLVGTRIAFYHQHPECLLGPAGQRSMSPRLIERLALTIAARITARHQSGAEPVSSKALAQEIGTIEERVLAVLDRLDAEGILVRSAEEPPRYLLSRSPRHIRIAELIDALHREVEDPGTLARLDRDPAVARIGEALEAARGNALDGLSLADLAPAQLASDQAEASDSRTGR
ncbi:MAG: YihY/virulence factor BrkB family protein [Chromatiaceae bacterium]|jgi:membrane protein|nr:YihY/virulence factor BrkB family protein [Chromatiaceae bacterium]